MPDYKPEEKEKIPLEQREYEMDRARILGAQKTESKIGKKEGDIPGIGMAQQLFDGSQGGPAAMVLGRGRNLTRMLLGGGAKGGGIMSKATEAGMELAKTAVKTAVKMAIRQMIQIMVSILSPFLVIIAKILTIVALVILVYYAFQYAIDLMSANYANISNIPQDFH